MAENPFDIAELITAYLQDSLSPDQRKALGEWLESDANRQFLNDFLQEDNFRGNLTQFAGTNAEATWNKTLKGLSKINPDAKVALNNIFKLFNVKWLAGAAALAAIWLGIYFVDPFGFRHSRVAQGTKVQMVNDVAPGVRGATLTLTNGKTVRLIGNKNGIVANASGITYDDGTPVDTSYGLGANKEPHSEDMVVASTANGRSYTFTLPDGTKVWLNAASSIRFPLSFTAGRREVEINGEAYLEVFKDKNHPFVVHSKDQQLEVLGTHFDIRSYIEDKNTKTTLLEGAVKITSLPSLPGAVTSLSGERSRPLIVLLKPNEQSIVQDGTIKVQPANTELETAWIKNDFYFHGETLENVLRDIARWYNVKIDFSNERVKSIPLIGQISRTKPLSAVLERIASAGGVRFKIEGKNVTVLADNN